MTQLTDLKSYKALQSHFNHLANTRMEDAFSKDPDRFTTFSRHIPGILLDFSKNRITKETLDLLIQLAHEANLTEKIAAFFSGEKINTTENRAVSHPLLRRGKKSPDAVKKALHDMRIFSENVRNRKWLGATGKPITHIVNVGIGGSHLGPEMTVRALNAFSQSNLHCHFISNVDHTHLDNTLKQLSAETSLFIFSSKSFSTIETLTHAKKIIAWLKNHLGNTIDPHLVAVTTAADKAITIGIPQKNIFPLWDWVGGRYSIWSAIGLPLAIMVGMDHFEDFLKGGAAIDEHFKTTPFEKNLPVLLALLGIWYTNFFEANAHAILPYADELSLFPAYLQQMDMESNGKQVTLDGTIVNYSTGPIIFGDQGCNGQHSFYQWLHQSPHVVPLDFILTGKEDDLLIASALSQAQAFMVGKPFSKALEKDTEWLAKHKTIPGNRPSNVIFLDKITPFHVGQLIALYEHKVFVQGVMWDINSFDQWGVELGKALLPPILNDLQQKEPSASQDGSTRGLIQHYQKLIRRSF